MITTAGGGAGGSAPWLNLLYMSSEQVLPSWPLARRPATSDWVDTVALSGSSELLGTRGSHLHVFFIGLTARGGITCFVPVSNPMVAVRRPAHASCIYSTSVLADGRRIASAGSAVRSAAVLVSPLTEKARANPEGAQPLTEKVRANPDLVLASQPVVLFPSSPWLVSFESVPAPVTAHCVSHSLGTLPTEVVSLLAAALVTVLLAMLVAFVRWQAAIAGSRRRARSEPRRLQARM